MLSHPHDENNEQNKSCPRLLLHQKTAESGTQPPSTMSNHGSPSPPWAHESLCVLPWLMAKLLLCHAPWLRESADLQCMLDEYLYFFLFQLLIYFIIWMETIDAITEIIYRTFGHVAPESLTLQVNDKKENCIY